MNVRICDVEHGGSAIVRLDDGRTLMIDCGHNRLTSTYPADHLVACGASSVDRLFITNYDEDHVSGLHHLRRSGTPIRLLNRNRTLSGEQLRALKQQGGPLREGMTALLAMIADYTADEIVAPGSGSEAFEYYVFHNNYPEFQDTNNLSLVVFLYVPGLAIVFPGDLEKAGWRALLADPVFRYQLSRVNVFVASHHGRESGYLGEVFDVCHPSVVIISDEAMFYDTQQHRYAQHALGIPWNGTDKRYVLTTRNDGTLNISTRQGGFFIQSSK